MRVIRDYGYYWVTLGLFLGSWGIQCALTESWAEFVRATMENWQSEALQLLWQVGGLTLLLAVGSPQSREASERLERKVDAILARQRRDQEPRW